MKRPGWIFSGLLLAMQSCAACPGPTDAGDAAALDAATGADSAIADSAVADAAPPVVGSSCTASQNDLQGTCPDGYACMPTPGGYCTKFCAGGIDCGPGAKCIDTANAGEVCATTCETVDQCRSNEGYRCHDQWQACTDGRPLNAAPIAPLCSGAPALAHTTFGSPRQISTAAGPGSYHPEIGSALDADGDLTALYSTRNGVFDPGQGAVSTVFADGQTNLDRPFPSSRSNHFDNWMASDRNGRLYAVWLGHDGGLPERNMQIAFSSSTDGLTWATPTVVHDPADCPGNAPGCLDKPMIVVAPDAGNPDVDALYVFYCSSSGLEMIKSLDQGVTFSTSVHVGAGCYGGVAIAADNVFHVVWVRANGDLYGSTSNRIEYVRSDDDGASFSLPVRVNASDEPVPFYNSNAQVVADPSRSAIHVVYASGTPDAVWDIKLATSLDSGATWSRIKVNDDATCANHMVPTLGFDPVSHRLHIAWLENRNGEGRLAYTSCEPGGGSCNGNETVSTTPFASFSLVRHSPKWMGEYYPMLIDAARRHIHLVWTQPVLEAGQPIGRVFHARGNL